MHEALPAGQTSPALAILYVGVHQRWAVNPGVPSWAYAALSADHTYISINRIFGMIKYDMCLVPTVSVGKHNARNSGWQ